MSKKLPEITVCQNAECGKTFPPKRSANGKRVRYCSDKCANRSRYLKARSQGKHWSHRRTLDDNSKLKKYGVTKEVMAIRMEIQGNLCYLCDKPFDDSQPGLSPVVEHNHITKVVRGIAHSKCNTAIGVFNDNPDDLRRAANRIEMADAGTLRIGNFANR